MSYILAGIKYCKLKRSMERFYRAYFERNASLGSRIPTPIKYYFHLLFLLFRFLDRAFSIMKTKNKPTKCTN